MKREDAIAAISEIADKLREAMLRRRGVPTPAYQADLRTCIDNMMGALDQLEQGDREVDEEVVGALVGLQASISAAFLLILEAYPDSFRVQLGEIEFETFGGERAH